MAKLKTEAPVFREEEDTAARVERLAGFAFQLRQELEYVLSHLGAGNMNAAGLRLTLADGGGRELGSLAGTEGGVRLAAGASAVTAAEGTVTLGCGGTLLRVTPDGVKLSADGGENWRDL